MNYKSTYYHDYKQRDNDVCRWWSLLSWIFTSHGRQLHRRSMVHVQCRKQNVVEHVWNVMAHAQKPDLVFQRNGRVHLNRRGRQFSRLLAAEVCASAVATVVMLDTPCSEVECKTTGYPLHSHVPPSLPLPCVTVCHQVSTELYQQHSYSHFYVIPTNCTGDPLNSRPNCCILK